MSALREPPPLIHAEVRLDVETGTLFVLGCPAHIPDLAERMDREETEDIEPFHNCNDMGCGSVGPHVLARVRLWQGGDHG